MSHRLLYCDKVGQTWRAVCECGWRGPKAGHSGDAEMTHGLHAASLFEVDDPA